MKRLATAFTGEWVANGGAPPSDFRFDPTPDALSTLRRNLTRALPDAVLLAVDGNQAALVKPFVGAIPAYASGLVFERPDAAVVRDLNDVRIVEIPWLVTPDAPQLASYPRRDSGSAALDRLYALGLDAFRISQAFGREPPERFELEGATGRIVLGEGRQFVREGRLAVYRDGRLIPLDARAEGAERPPARSAEARATAFLEQRGLRIVAQQLPHAARRDRPDRARGRHAGLRRGPPARVRCLRRRRGQHHAPPSGRA